MFSGKIYRVEKFSQMPVATNFKSGYTKLATKARVTAWERLKYFSPLPLPPPSPPALLSFLQYKTVHFSTADVPVQAHCRAICRRQIPIAIVRQSLSPFSHKSVLVHQLINLLIFRQKIDLTVSLWRQTKVEHDLCC